MTLEQHVHEALDNAHANGYVGFLRSGTDLEIVDDLLKCDADLERLAADVPHSILAGYVRNWRRTMKGKL